MEPEEAGDSLRTCDGLQCVSPWWMCSRKGGGLTRQERKLLDVAGRESWASNNGRPRKMVGEPVDLGWAAEETR